MRAFINTRSMTPRNLSSAPMGSWRGTAFLPSLVRIWLTTAVKFAPMRSILLMKAMRGTPYLSACATLSRLRLHAADGAENADRTVEDAQRTLHFDREVDVARKYR